MIIEKHFKHTWLFDTVVIINEILKLILQIILKGEKIK